MQELDNVQINFDASGLWVLNIALAVVMFGVALGIKMDDFKILLSHDPSHWQHQVIDDD